jgi:phosphohistidine phosphatase
MTAPGHRRLILTRHAKSSWEDPLMADEDRPLNRRGQRAARELGDFLASRGYEPEEVLCSPALRTRETWEGLTAAVLEVRPALRMEAALYQAGPDAMLEVLKTATTPVVMMLGHNPGIAEFAAKLPDRMPTPLDYRRYPTAATAVLDFQIESWDQLTFGSGTLRDFFVPTRG